jgi:hypothetical protein
MKSIDWENLMESQIYRHTLECWFDWICIIIISFYKQERGILLYPIFFPPKLIIYLFFLFIFPNLFFLNYFRIKDANFCKNTSINAYYKAEHEGWGHCLNGHCLNGHWQNGVLSKIKIKLLKKISSLP